jgi:hypothetical protein
MKATNAETSIHFFFMLPPGAGGGGYANRCEGVRPGCSDNV